MNEWYMHKSESIQENETHKLLLDFDVRTDPLISSTPIDIQQKREPGEYRILPLRKIERKRKRDQYLDLARGLKNYRTWEWQWY